MKLLLFRINVGLNVQVFVSDTSLKMTSPPSDKGGCSAAGFGPIFVQPDKFTVCVCVWCVFVCSV